MLEMKERPILFNGESVKAILAGRKTQTRRVIKPQPDVEIKWASHPELGSVQGHWFRKLYKYGCTGHSYVDDLHFVCPYGRLGDHLWVRETWRTEDCLDGLKPSELPEDASLWYCADHRSFKRLTDKPGKKRPSIFMPRWASRLTLEITDVRVEQLQGIDAQGIVDEGVQELYCPPGYQFGEAIFDHKRDAFANFWNSINEEQGFGWDENPWVWIVEFKAI